MSQPKASSEALRLQLAADAASLQESAIEERLALTVEQRIEAHENARQLYEDLLNAGERIRAKPQSTP